MISRRLAGGGVPGSSHFHKPESRVVIVNCTRVPGSSAKAANRSRSRHTSVDLVTTETGVWKSRNASRMARVMPYRPSHGW